MEENIMTWDFETFCKENEILIDEEVKIISIEQLEIVDNEINPEE